MQVAVFAIGLATQMVDRAQGFKTCARFHLGEAQGVSGKEVSPSLASYE